jgi:hypothetical protein
MSKMKSTLAATLLTLVLAVPAFSGNIDTPSGSTPPPPPPPVAEISASVPNSSVPGDASGLGTTIVDVLLAVLRMF